MTLGTRMRNVEWAFQGQCISPGGVKYRRCIFDIEVLHNLFHFVLSSAKKYFIKKMWKWKDCTATKCKDRMTETNSTIPGELSQHIMLTSFLNTFSNMRFVILDKYCTSLVVNFSKCSMTSGGAGGGEGVLFLRAPSVKQIFGPRVPKSFFPIFDFALGVIHLRKIA